MKLINRNTSIKGLKRLCVSAIVTGIMITSCLGGDQGVESKFMNKQQQGRSMTIELTGLHHMNQLSYHDNIDNVNLIAKPSPEWEFVAVSMALINFRSGQVSLVIDEDAARLVDSDGVEYVPIDPLARTQETGEETLWSPLGLPRLWGQVELEQRMEVRGFLYFEVPKTADVNYMIWDETDSIRVDF